MRKGARQRALRLPTHGQPRSTKRAAATGPGCSHGGGIETAAIVLPRETKSQPGDFGCVEQTIRTPQVQPGKKLTGKLFIADTRIDNAYRNVRSIEVAVNGKQVFRRDVADPQAKDWVVFDLTGLAGAESLKIQVRVVEERGVADHTSWVFVGPLTLAVE